MASEAPIQVTLEPMGLRVDIQPGITLLECAQQAGVEINAVCGGNGTCGMCKVLLVRGKFSALNELERSLLDAGELEQGLRLACQVEVMADARVQFPPESLASLQRLQLEGQTVSTRLHPAIQVLELDLAEVDLASLAANPESLSVLMKEQHQRHIQMPPEVLALLPARLKASPQKLRIACYRKQAIALPAPQAGLPGFAVDIGTTKVAGYLVDLESGQTLAAGGITNPQIAYGEDVISRIEYSDQHPQGGRILQQALATGLNELLASLCREGGGAPEEVLDAVIVGNTAMHHLLTGYSVHSLGTAPYVPAVTRALYLPARDLGLHFAPGARVYLPPNIAGFVGGDHVAMLLATRAAALKKTVVALDIGTNTEISLIHRGRHFACSCASGPAFEGAHIREGMRAIPGAIERVRLEGGQAQVHTIQGQPAIGICGSGILDSVAELRRLGLVDHRGAFNKQDERIRMKNGQPAFVLVPAAQSGLGREIAVNRQDVNEIQLAKAAIRSGVEVLLRRAGINYPDIELFLVAGAFGSYLDLGNAVRIGMFPPIPRERFQQVGNAAGSGARQMLLSTRRRAQAERLTGNIEYIELTTEPGYTEIFMDAIQLPDIGPQ